MPVDRQSARKAQLRRGRRAAVAPASLRAVAGDRRDDPGGVHLAHTLLVAVSDVDVALPVNRHPVRRGHPRRGRRAAIADIRRNGDTAASDGRDRPGHVYLADSPVVAVSDVDVAHSVDRHALAAVGFDGYLPSAGRCGGPVCRHGWSTYSRGERDMRTPNARPAVPTTRWSQHAAPAKVWSRKGLPAKG